MGAGLAVAGAVAKKAVDGVGSVATGVTDGVKTAASHPMMNGSKLHDKIEAGAEALNDSLINLIEKGQWTTYKGGSSVGLSTRPTKSNSARRAKVVKQAESGSASITQQAEAAEEVASLGGDDFAMMMG